jgi:tetratricopeptide (TPR) repeat protein
LSEARSSLVDSLAPHFNRSEDTPALIEQHSLLELVRKWSSARVHGDRTAVDSALAAMPEHVRAHLQGISTNTPARQQAIVPNRLAETVAPATESDETRLRRELLESLKGQSSSSFEPGLAGVASAIARALLEEAPRDGIALRVIAHSSELDRQFETAIHFWERAARVTLDATERAGVYVRIAKILADELGNLNGALENAIVAFICAPHSHEAVHILETRYRATGRYKDLHSVYVDAADAALERNETERASDLLARRAQLEFQALKRPEAAAATLIRAIELAPDPAGLLALLRTHIAPVAGSVWVERAERAIAERPGSERSPAAER